VLIDSYRFSGAFDPVTDLDGTLAFWGKQSYDITSSPDIDEWNDESGNNNDPAQTTAVDKPHQTADIINGFDVARFDGVGDFLDAGSPFQAEGQDQLGYGFVLRAVDGQPAISEMYIGAVNSPAQDRPFYLFVGTTGKIIVFYESNDNLGRWASQMQLANGVNIFGLIVWIDKDGDNTIKVGYASGSTFTELADDGVDTGDLTGVTPADLVITDNVYWGARNNAGSDGLHAQIDITEGFIQKGMTQKDFDNWGQRFLDIYNL